MKSLEEKVKPFITVILIAAFLIFAVAWGLWKYQYTNVEKLPVTYLQVAASTSPAGQSVLPEQRRKFALEFEKQFTGKGMKATVTTTGAFHTSVVVRGSVVNEPLVLGMKESKEAVRDLRDMGFKHLIMTDGTTSWDVDLKN
jgi:hypothetical protein